MCFIFFLLSSLLFGQTASLREYSDRINRDLPEPYDSITRLRKTTVENQELVFHFLIKATKEEYASAHPKVKDTVLGSICRHGREGRVLRELRRSIIYRYENDRGQSLGEFTIRPAHCEK